MTDQVDERTDQTPPGDGEPAGRAGRAGAAESRAAGATGPARRGEVRQRRYGVPDTRQEGTPGSASNATEDASGASDGRGAVAGPLVRECGRGYRLTSGQVVAVLLYPNGGYSLLWPHGREDHDKPFLRGAFTAFEVRLGRHVTTFALELPAAGDVESFQAEARVHWEVDDPYAVVRHQVWDAAELLRDDLLDRLRDVSRRYRLTEAQHADEAVKAELASGRFALGEELGLRTTVHVFIDLSERVADKARQRTDLDHEMTLTRRRDDHESALVAARAQEFEAMLRDGNVAQIAHFMARDPDKALEIRNLIRQERREEHASWLELLTKLINSGHLERHDIGEHMYDVIQYLRDRSDAIVPHTVQVAFEDRRRPRPALGAGEDRPRRTRPFWEDAPPDPATDPETDQAGAGPEGEADSEADTEADGAAGAGGGDGPREPTRVESSAERARRARLPRDPRRAAPRGGRPSDRFDDWDAL